MLPYKILEHKADLKIKVWGKTKKDLFINAMKGMLTGAGYEAENKSKIRKRKLKIKSFDLISLLNDFLSEILYLCETKKEVYQEIIFNKFTDQEIEATLLGRELKRMSVHIKGVTYHDLKIEQTKEGWWQTTILFDI